MDEKLQFPKVSPSNLDCYIIFLIFILYHFLTDYNFQVVDKSISKCWPCLGFLNLRGFVYHNHYFSLKNLSPLGKKSNFAGVKLKLWLRGVYYMLWLRSAWWVSCEIGLISKETNLAELEYTNIHFTPCTCTFISKQTIYTPPTSFLL